MANPKRENKGAHLDYGSSSCDTIVFNRDAALVLDVMDERKKVSKKLSSEYH